MNGLKVIGAVVILLCLTASAKQDKEALVHTSPVWSRARVAITRTANGTTLLPEIERCILLISRDIPDGGGPLLEWYHPTAACNIPRISTERVEEILFVSGCYLPETQQITTATTGALPYYAHTFGSASAMVGGRCVSCGGWGSSSLSECYSFSTTHWTSLPPMPHGLCNAASVAIGADFYVIGGLNSTYEQSDQVYHYNTATNQWHTGTPMDDTRVWHSAAALSDTELIVCGGWGQAEVSRRDCVIYNTTTRRWTPAAELNHVRDNFTMVIFGGRVYALGGSIQSRTILKGGIYHTTLDTVEVYDRAADSWTIVDKKLKGGRSAFIGLVV